LLRLIFAIGCPTRFVSFSIIELANSFHQHFMPDYFISYDDAEKDLLACSAYLAERIKSSDGHAEAMKTIIPKYLGKRNVDLAAELANAVDDPFSRDQLLTMVAEKCAEFGDDEYALQLVEAVEDQGMQAQAYETGSGGMAHRGDTVKAAEIAETMAHPDFVYAGIAVQQAESGDESAANLTLDKIDFPPPASPPFCIWPRLL
jgi:hypothetical protein